MMINIIDISLFALFSEMPNLSNSSARLKQILNSNRIWTEHQNVQFQDSAVIHHAAAKAKEKIRLNSLKLLHFDSRYDQLIQDSYQQVLAFTDGLQLSSTLSALQVAHIAADEYYTVQHALAWNTDFVFPAEAIAADSMLFRECCYDLLRCVAINKAN